MQLVLSSHTWRKLSSLKLFYLPSFREDGTENRAGNRMRRLCDLMEHNLDYRLIPAPCDPRIPDTVQLILTETKLWVWTRTELKSESPSFTLLLFSWSLTFDPWALRVVSLSSPRGDAQSIHGVISTWLFLHVAGGAASAQRLQECLGLGPLWRFLCGFQSGLQLPFSGLRARCSSPNKGIRGGMLLYMGEHLCLCSWGK